MPSRRLGFALLTLVAASGCTSSPWRQRVIETDERVFLYREHREVDGTREPLGFAHPIDVDAHDVAALLSHLVFVEKRWFADPVERPIFTQDQAERFAEPLAAALTALAPDERLRFLVPESSFSNVLSGSTGTSGVVFASSEGVIDVAFDSVHEGINDGDGGRPEDVYFAEDPTTTEHARTVVPFAGSRRRFEPETRRDHPGWIVVDRQALAGLPQIATRRLAQPEAAAEPIRASPHPATASRDETTSATGPTAAGGTRAGSTTAATTAAREPAAGESAPVPPPPSDSRYDDVRRKLANLKRLHADGVITDEEYAAQFESLMDEL